MIRIYIDFKSPGAYLALQPTLALLERHQPDSQWLAFSGSTFNLADNVPQHIDNEDKGSRHRRVRALARRDTHLLYAAQQGLTMHFQQPAHQCDLALAVLCATNGANLDYIKASFAAYWQAGLDLNQAAVVGELMTRSGLDADLLAQLQTEELLATAQSRAAQDGVVDAPAYVIAEQLFIGREHLPWVEELILAG